MKCGGGVEQKVSICRKLSERQCKAPFNTMLASTQLFSNEGHKKAMIFFLLPKDWVRARHGGP